VTLARHAARSAGSLLPLAGSLLAIVAAFLVGGLFLLTMGKDPLAVYDRLVGRGLLSSFGVTETLIKAAPLLVVAAGLLVALRAGVWNIGVDGQFLVGAILTGWVAPALVDDVPKAVELALACLAGFSGGLLWAVVPAWLRVRFGLNEIITTIMMNYVAISLTAYLVKGPLKDPNVVPPQTELIPPGWRLPDLPGTEVHAGLAIGVVAVLVVTWVYRSTVVGLMWWVLGQNRRAALHAGLPVGVLTGSALLISGGFAGLAGSSDVLSTAGLFKANWYPAYGLSAFALVYLARLNGLWVLPFAYFFGWLALGGDLLRSEDVPNSFVGILEGLMLAFLAVAVVVERRIVGSPSRSGLGEAASIERAVTTDGAVTLAARPGEAR
jgi:general nucleoside transport system permease protein